MQVRVGIRGLALDTTSRAARELTRRSGRAFHDRTDFVERHAEHFVEHEGEAFRRLKGFEETLRSLR
jgi:hypothetical protein